MHTHIGRVTRVARYASALLALLLGLSAGLAFAAGRGDQTLPKVYTVSQIRAVLAQQPASWVGRTVQVRGILDGPFVFCGATRPCPPPTLGLIDNENGSVGPGQYLPVLAGPPIKLWAFLRQFPALSRFAPEPQPLHFGLMALYHLRLEPAPSLCSRNSDVLCYEGVVLDAAPL
jgi:hypothetical protein